MYTYHVTAVLWLLFVVHIMLFLKTNFFTFMLVLSEVCVQYLVWLFLCFSVCCSGIFWMIVRWLQLRLLLLASPLFIIIII